MASDLNEETIDATLNKIKAADPSKKIDIIQVFGIKLERVTELPTSCYSAITLLLPSLIKSPNHLLQHAVLVQLLPYYLPLIPLRPQEHLRLALHQLLPLLLEKLHDSKEKIHTPAETCIIILGGLCNDADAESSGMSESGSTPSVSGSHKGKDKETLSSTFESKLKEAFAGKGARSKLGAMNVLLGVREQHNNMALRPYLPILVDALQDGDGTVREVSRSTIIHLLSPSSVPPAARSELRKLMTLKAVKPALADAIIQQIHEGPQAVASPSALTSGANAVEEKGLKLESEGSIAPILVDTERELQTIFSKMHPWFEGKETEQNWLEREKGVNCVRGLLTGGVHRQFVGAFMAVMKEWFAHDSAKVILSLRTTLATATIALYKELAEELGKHLDPVADIMLTALGKMSPLTKKIVAEQAQRALLAMIKHTSCHARFFLPFLLAGVSEKNVQARQYHALYLKTYIETHGAADKHHIDAVGLDGLTDAVKKAMADINPIVKDHGRAAYWLYATIWPKEATSLIDSLDPTARKQLERAKTSSDTSAGPAQPPARRPIVSSASEAIRKARMESRGRMRVVSAETPPRELEVSAASRRFSLQPNLAPLAAAEPRNVLPLTEPNLAKAELSGDLEEVNGDTTRESKLLETQLHRAETPRAVRTTDVQHVSNGTASASRLPRMSSAKSPKHASQAVPQRPATTSTPPSVSSQSLPNSPPPQTLGETLLDVDLSFWLDNLPGSSDDVTRILGPSEQPSVLSALKSGPLAVDTLQRLSATILDSCPVVTSDTTAEEIQGLIESRRQTAEVASPVPGSDGAFLAEALVCILQHSGSETGTEVLEEILFCLWSLCLWHPALTSGKEAEIYTLLFELRKSSESQIRRNSAALSAVLTETTQDPVYQLNVVFGQVQRLIADGALNPKNKERIIVFGLVTIARLVVRLPAAVTEEELKRLKGFVMDAMNSSSIICREAAATTILALQSSLRDESLLFGLLPALTVAQRNLLTYMFEKHSGFRKRDGRDVVGRGGKGDEMLTREMRRLSMKM